MPLLIFPTNFYGWPWPFPIVAAGFPEPTVPENLLDQIGNILINAGVVNGGTGWTLCQSFEPPTPDKVVVLYETPGEPPDIVRPTSPETAYDLPGIQVRVRGDVNKYKETTAKIREVFMALHGQEPGPVAGELTCTFIYGIGSGPLPLGLDGSNRPELTWNFRVMRERE